MWQVNHPKATYGVNRQVRRSILKDEKGCLRLCQLVCGKVVSGLLHLLGHSGTNGLLSIQAISGSPWVSEVKKSQEQTMTLGKGIRGFQIESSYIHFSLSK